MFYIQLKWTYPQPLMFVLSYGKLSITSIETTWTSKANYKVLCPTTYTYKAIRSCISWSLTQVRPSMQSFISSIQTLCQKDSYPYLKSFISLLYASDPIFYFSFLNEKHEGIITYPTLVLYITQMNLSTTTYICSFLWKAVSSHPPRPRGHVKPTIEFFVRPRMPIKTVESCISRSSMQGQVYSPQCHLYKLFFKKFSPRIPNLPVSY